jgi:cytochrome c oxidase subunit 3
MYLFILSEALLFVSFFWAYFYITTAPQFDVATVLPRDIKPLNYLSVPLYNTFLLVLSGLAATVAEKGTKIRIETEEQEIEQILNPINSFDLKIEGNIKSSKTYQVRLYTLAMYALAIILGLFFTALQLFEYKTTSFSAEDSVYGSIFFLTTGFHGLHVIVGTIFLIFSMYQQYKYEVTLFTNVSIKFANIYWHFVDAIWIGLYLLYYYYITLR